MDYLLPLRYLHHKRLRAELRVLERAKPGMKWTGFGVGHMFIWYIIPAFVLLGTAALADAASLPGAGALATIVIVLIVLDSWMNLLKFLRLRSAIKAGNFSMQLVRIREIRTKLGIPNPETF